MPVQPFTPSNNQITGSLSTNKTSPHTNRKHLHPFQNISFAKQHLKNSPTYLNRKCVLKQNQMLFWIIVKFFVNASGGWQKVPFFHWIGARASPEVSLFEESITTRVLRKHLLSHFCVSVARKCAKHGTHRTLIVVEIPKDHVFFYGTYE